MNELTPIVRAASIGNGHVPESAMRRLSGLGFTLKNALVLQQEEERALRRKWSQVETQHQVLLTPAL